MGEHPPLRQQALKRMFSLPSRALHTGRWGPDQSPGSARRPMQACPGKYCAQVALRGRAHSGVGATGASSTYACVHACMRRPVLPNTQQIRASSSTRGFTILAAAILVVDPNNKGYLVRANAGAIRGKGVQLRVAHIWAAAQQPDILRPLRQAARVDTLPPLAPRLRMRPNTSSAAGACMHACMHG